MRYDFCPITSTDVSVYSIPTTTPEADGTLEWNATTLVCVELGADGQGALGYTYADAASGSLARRLVAEHVKGKNVFETTRITGELARSVRNLGRPGIAAMAISAIDCALWDLKAKLLGVPLAVLLGLTRPSIEAYGSGGFTNYSIGQLEAQLLGWSHEGFRAVKMKVGSCPDDDARRVALVRKALGPEIDLYVDGNGAYTRTQALALAGAFADQGVSWFEEPMPVADREGLRWMRDRARPGLRVVAGEYGYEAGDFLDLLQTGAVDVLQADVTRCGGVTGFLQAAALADAFRIPLSSHCAPSQHVALGCAVPAMTTLEYFHDHARIERIFFEGAVTPSEGRLAPDLSRAGFGLELKRRDAAVYSAA